MKDGLMQEYISKLQKLAVDYPLTESTSKYLNCGIRETSYIPNGWDDRLDLYNNLIDHYEEN